MRGHEYARAQVKSHLAATVGARLSAIRAALAVSTPHNPAAGSYLLSDQLPVDPAAYPCVVVMSSGSPRIRKQSVRAAGDAADFIVVYDLRVVVACRTDVAGGEEAASVDRDRLLLAVRESLLGKANLPDDIEILTDELREETGAASQDVRGRPLAAGQITFTAAVLETLAALPAPDALVVSDVDVVGNPSATPDITPAP
jgi:hypothetical protein